jgi:hypothetical protein
MLVSSAICVQPEGEVVALPDEEHRHQLYAYSGVGLPVQVPGLPVSVAPIADEPLIVGAELLTGGWTIAVVLGEKFGVEPTELVARIFTRRSRLI